MRKTLIPALTGLFCLLVMALSCDKDTNFSEIPYLEFVGYEFIQKDGVRYMQAEIYFTDGDGDIGLDENDLDPPFGPDDEYHNNLWVFGYRIANGNYIDTVDFSGRIPYITPSGQNKTLEGTIYYDIILDGTAIGDTMQFEFELIDRALNHSDRIKSPKIRIEN